MGKEGGGRDGEDRGKSKDDQVRGDMEGGVRGRKENYNNKDNQVPSFYLFTPNLVYVYQAKLQEKKDTSPSLTRLVLLLLLTSLLSSIPTMLNLTLFSPPCYFHPCISTPLYAPPHRSTFLDILTSSSRPHSSPLPCPSSLPPPSAFPSVLLLIPSPTSTFLPGAHFMYFRKGLIVIQTEDMLW